MIAWVQLAWANFMQMIESKYNELIYAQGLTYKWAFMVFDNKKVNLLLDEMRVVLRNVKAIKNDFERRRAKRKTK